MTQDASDFTRLIATYETPAVLSDFPISIHAFGSVSPWLLCIGRAQACNKTLFNVVFDHTTTGLFRAVRSTDKHIKAHCHENAH